MAPHGPNIEQDGFVFAFGAGEGAFVPFIPVDGLVGGGTEIRARGIFKTILGHG
jgi:hypothetical protein